jgi:hypothetical protein
MKASRPQKVVSPPPQPQAPEPEKDPDRYMKRTSLVAKPTLGNPVIVTTVGLGNLTVQTATGVAESNPE